MCAHIDRLQRRMAACRVWLHKGEQEDMVALWRRKAAVVQPLIQQTWSEHVAGRIQLWSYHLARARNDSTFSHHIVRMRSLAWLDMKRAGTQQLALRASGGMPPLRWEQVARRAADISKCQYHVFWCRGTCVQALSLVRGESLGVWREGERLCGQGGGAFACGVRVSWSLGALAYLVTAWGFLLLSGKWQARTVAACAACCSRPSPVFGDGGHNV